MTGKQNCIIIYISSSPSSPLLFITIMIFITIITTTTNLINIMINDKHHGPAPSNPKPSRVAKRFSDCKATHRLLEWAGEKGFFLVLCGVCNVSSSVMVKISMIYLCDHCRPQHNIKYFFIFVFVFFYSTWAEGKRCQCLCFFPFFAIFVFFLYFFCCDAGCEEISKFLMFVFFWPLFAIFLFV